MSPNRRQNLKPELRNLFTQREGQINLARNLIPLAGIIIFNWSPVSALYLIFIDFLFGLWAIMAATAWRFAQIFEQAEKTVLWGIPSFIGLFLAFAGVSSMLVIIPASMTIFPLALANDAEPWRQFFLAKELWLLILPSFVLHGFDAFKRAQQYRSLDLAQLAEKNQTEVGPLLFRVFVIAMFSVYCWLFGKIGVIAVLLLIAIILTWADSNSKRILAAMQISRR
jgi:hypothetical protein